MGEALITRKGGGISKLPVGIQFAKEEPIAWTYTQDTQYSNKFRLTAPSSFQPVDDTIYMIQMYFDTVPLNANNKNWYYKCSLELGIVYKYIAPYDVSLPGGSSITNGPFYWTKFPFDTCGMRCIPYDATTGEPIGVQQPSGSNVVSNGIKIIPLQSITFMSNSPVSMDVVISSTGVDSWTTTSRWDTDNMVIRTMSSDVMR